MNPEAFYAQWGYVRAPREGLFSFRLRAEAGTNIMVRDPNRLRERLYLLWWRRRGAPVRAIAGYDTDVVSALLSQVAHQFAT